MTERLTDERLAELRTIAEAATSGDWSLIGGGEYLVGPGIQVAPDDGGVSSADAAHIAAFDPPTVLALLDRIDNPRDEYHTMDELYRYRMLYNALLANLLACHGGLVHKSRRHATGEECFGGGWFIVTMQLPTGRVSNHYKAEHWDLFHVPEQELADEWDGHTPEVAADRMERAARGEQA